MKPDILQVQTFGKFALTYAGKQISCTGSRSRLNWNILAYLLCHRGDFVFSEELMGAIWKTEKNDNPAGAMRTAIHRVRSMLSELTEDGDISFLISKNGGYMWNPDVEMTVDMDAFEQLARSAEEEEDLASALAALELYEGKFLPLQASEIWVMPIQTYYHNRFLSLMDQVIPALEREGRCAEGIALCRRALQTDPYSEKLYQHLMRLLLEENDRQEVMRLYEEMSKLLLSTFGILPDQESRALYREALSSSTGNVVSPETARDQLREQGEISGALICDYDFFRMMYQAQARAIVRTGQVIHIALLTLKGREKREVSEKSLSLAMDNLEKHLSRSLRKGDVITRCSASQFMVMLPSSNYENSGKVCRRFIASFEKKYPHSPVYVDFCVQPLTPSTRS